MGVTWSVSDFEFVGAEPFDNASTFKAFIPSLKVNSDNSSGKLTSINLKFYRQSSTGSFDNVTTTFFETVAWNIFCVYALKTAGHKNDSAFQRYNLVTEEEMLGMKWLDLKKDEHRTMDTYMDTKALS